MYTAAIIYKTFKVNMIKKSLKINTASGTTLGLTGITPVELNIDNQIVVNNFVICTKLKQPLILGLNLLRHIV